jgi:glutathione-regulated potassium-efflux system ancillary protein KefC
MPMTDLSPLHLHSIQVMDIMPVGFAFGMGLFARSLGLPPLVGFLLCGFILVGLDYQSSIGLQQIADIGVTLLLFVIGLKLNVKRLLKPSIWGVAGLHMVMLTLLGAAFVGGLGVVGLSTFTGLDLKASLLIGFALSFSSTVFAVKVFEESGEMDSTHGKISIGILIMQDLFAVIFMTLSAGKIPSPYALLLFLLLPLRPLLLKLLEKAGHGEMMVLSGWLIPLGGAALFQMVGVKADLGALLMGVLLSGTSKAEELSKALYSFKDLFLIGFFLTIGLTGSISLDWIGCAALILLLLIPKTLCYFWLMTKFKLRARSATLASLSLANYSEFGLIVVAVGQSTGYLSGNWMVGIAVALALSFVMASPTNRFGKKIYEKFHDRLVAFESKDRLAGDEIIDTGKAEILVFGMGRVGSSAYTFLSEKFGDVVLGIERDLDRLNEHMQSGRNVIFGDATDMDFWARKQVRVNVQWVLLTFPDYRANVFVANVLKQMGIKAKMASIATYDDQVDKLKKAGVDEVFNFYIEAGLGFAEHVFEEMEATSKT